MANIIGDLAVRIGADTSGLTRGLKRSRRQVGQLASEARSGSTQLAKYGAAAAAAGATVAAALVKSSIAATKETANLARMANASVETFQKQAFAARKAGIEQDKLADIYKDMSDRVGDFLSTGGGPMADFFENIAPKVGVTAKEFRNLSGPQAMQLYVDSLEKANVSQNEMTFYMEAIASDSSALIPLLRDGGKAMAEQAKQADALGLALSGIQVAQMEQAADSMRDVQEIAGGFVDQFSANLSPVLTAFSNQLIGAAKDAGGVGVAANNAFEMAVKGASFVLDAVEGIKRTFQIAGRGIALFGLGAMDVLLSVANTVVNGPVQAINELIEVMNKLPGVDITPVVSDLGDSIRRELQNVRGAQAVGLEDIQAILSAPMPSVAFKSMVKQAEEASEQAAAEVAKIQQAVVPGMGGGQTGQEGKDNEEQREKLAKRLETIRDANKTERELQLEQFAKENEDLNTALENKMITRQQWAEMSKEQKAREEQVLTDIEEKQADKRKKLAEDEAQFKRKALGDALSSLSTLMNSESKKQFKIGQAAALAGALVDGYAAITGAYKVGASIGGPVLGAAYGAAAGAATFKQIQAIRSASVGGSGGGSSGGGGGSVTQSVNAQGEAVRGQSAQGGQTMTLQGIDPNSLFTGRQLIETINEAQRNGAVLQVQS